VIIKKTVYLDRKKYAPKRYETEKIVLSLVGFEPTYYTV